MGPRQPRRPPQGIGALALPTEPAEPGSAQHDPTTRSGRRLIAMSGPSTGSDRTHDADAPAIFAVVSAKKAESDAGAVHAATQAWRAQGRDVQVAVTDGETELAEALGSVDGRRLVLLGGDGSVHTIIGGLHAAGVLQQTGPVGLVPLGTGNDLAHSLRLPLEDVGAAARIAGGGATAPMDLLVRTSREGAHDGWHPRIAVNALHVGIGVAASESAEGLKPRWGALGYPLGAVAAGAKAPVRRLKVVVDDEVVHDGDEPLAMVALSLGSTIGGGAPIAPGASPHDGLVRVVLSASDSLPARAGYALDVLRGRQKERGDVRGVSGRRVTVEDVDGRPFAMDVDGDLSGEVVQVGWEVWRAAWTAAVPEGPAAPATTPPGG